MGYNSLIMICNDYIHSIERDPKTWWEEAWDALCRTGYNTTVRFGNFEAVWNQHADVIGLIAVGRNSARVISSHYHSGFYEDEAVINLLKEAADKFGYRLVKKSVKKKAK